MCLECKHIRLSSAIIASCERSRLNAPCFSKSCFTQPCMTERKMDRRYYLSSEPSVKWAIGRFQNVDVKNVSHAGMKGANAWAAFCKWKGHSSVKWMVFFNPRLFDLIRPICICSRVMVRMKAAAVIAFSRRIQHPPHLLLPLYCNYSCSLPLQSFAFATNAFVSTLWCEI